MRKILSLFVALTAVLSLSAKTVYLNPAAGWADADAVTFIHAWGGLESVTNVEMLPVEEGSPILCADAKDNDQIVFVRMKPGSTEIAWDGVNKYWNKTNDLPISGENDMFTISDFSGEIANGSWSVYGKFYITGDSALVVDAGFDKSIAWTPNAIPATSDSKVITLKAHQTYKMKVTVYGTWDTTKQFDNLTDTAGGLFIDSDINICFRLAADGNVTVNYTNSEFTLSGDFAAPTVGIVGNFEGDGTWSPSAHVMIPADDKKSASVSFNITNKGADYEMKVYQDGYYLSLNSGKEKELFRIHRTYNHADNVNLYNSGDNFALEADVTGNYTFTWTYATRNLVVTYPTTPTAIDNTEAEGKAVKRIVNGQLVIEKNGVRYNALGIEVK